MRLKIEIRELAKSFYCRLVIGASGQLCTRVNSEIQAPTIDTYACFPHFPTTNHALEPRLSARTIGVIERSRGAAKIPSTVVQAIVIAVVDIAIGMTKNCLMHKDRLTRRLYESGGVVGMPSLQEVPVPLADIFGAAGIDTSKYPRSTNGDISDRWADWAERFFDLPLIFAGRHMPIFYQQFASREL